MSDIPDYQNYSSPELYQALNSIVPERYPDTFALLEQELARRQPTSRAELIECYYQLDKARWPQHAASLKQKIEALGGFETVLATTVSEQVRYRTFWRRFWAQLIDALVFLIPAMVVLAVLAPRFDDTRMVNAYLQEALQYLTYAYSILMHANFGQTIGKMVVGVKVKDVSEERNIGYGQALLRDAVPLGLTVIMSLYFFSFGTRYDENELQGINAILANAIGFIAGAWALAELLTMLLNKKRRAVHDLIAGTVVVRLP